MQPACPSDGEHALSEQDEAKNDSGFARRKGGRMFLSRFTVCTAMLILAAVVQGNDSVEFRGRIVRIESNSVAVRNGKDTRVFSRSAMSSSVAGELREGGEVRVRYVPYVIEATIVEPAALRKSGKKPQQSREEERRQVIDDRAFYEARNWHFCCTLASRRTEPLIQGGYS